ncbi:peptidase S14 ClpP [Klebsiella pneumoniae subsp. ozaenae]|uniref:Peptidase S14 ClpP n=1 Tax=Klebsiella pneumoniae subsp. ozaenae TaxID=574 RepID=A0A377ZD30_KLEPO|nr:peptidase S14 ClpP [Klebsiella pneumoniae subsp. ozaenae]
MPKSKNRTPRRPKASARSNSWFRMQASADNQVEIYIYDEIGYWGVTAGSLLTTLKRLVM